MPKHSIKNILSSLVLMLLLSFSCFSLSLISSKVQCAVLPLGFLSWVVSVCLFPFAQCNLSRWYAFLSLKDASDILACRRLCTSPQSNLWDGMWRDNTTNSPQINWTPDIPLRTCRMAADPWQRHSRGLSKQTRTNGTPLGGSCSDMFVALSRAFHEYP